MSDDTTPAGHDRALAGRLATLMRGGTAAAVALLVVGVVLLAAGARLPSTVALTAGCAALVLLPLVRLVLMLRHFARRSDTPFVVITALVIGLVVAGAAAGLVV
ncbi:MULTISPECIES: hypothetical protein [unclassified Isoptericola]|uniref:hypothetical protein n=1 Tax=unclassified Isoptericola TaxID=2623355 RepID=UPI0036694C2D